MPTALLLPCSAVGAVYPDEFARPFLDRIAFHPGGR